MWLAKGGRATLRNALDALADGARHALPAGAACALADAIIGILTLTGAAAAFAGTIIEIGRHSFFLSPVLTMPVCLVLGTGIPAIRDCIVTRLLAAPALLQLGVPPIVSHRFVFQFGIIADLTPPVVLAAFAAAPIARESAMQVGLRAMRLAIAGLVVPFVAACAPALMLQRGSWWDTGRVAVKAIIAIALWGGAAIGCWLAPLNRFERLRAFAAAAFFVAAAPATDEIGLPTTAAPCLWPAMRAHASRR